MGNFFNNGPTFFKLIIKSWYKSYINIYRDFQELFLLKIYRSQMDYRYKSNCHAITTTTGPLVTINICLNIVNLVLVR